MAHSPDHALAPASAAPSGIPSGVPDSPSAAPSGIPSGVPDSPSAVPAGPPWPNPLASIAYASCRPADIDSPAEDSALTSRAAYERLNRAAARAETLVLYRLDMLAGCRDSLDVDQTRLERSIQNLWRLTAVRKTLISIEAALSAPPSAPQGAAPESELQSALAEVNRLLAEFPTGSADVPSAPVPADSFAPASAEPPLPVVLSPSPSPSQSGLESQSQSCSRSQSPSGSSIPSIGSIGSMGSIGSIETIPPVAPSSARPFAPSSSLAIGSVPACPRLSLSSVARTLDRVNADMAQYTEYVTIAADYNSNLTAEEFLRPPLSPKSSRVPAVSAPTPAADDSAINDTCTTPGEDASLLLTDPDLSPSLKSQISTRQSSPASDIPHSINPQSEIRNPQSSCPSVAPSPSRPIAPSPPLRISHFPHHPG